MKEMSKYIRIFIIIGIVASIIGYLALLYKGYSLNNEIKYQEEKRDSLKIETNKLVKYNEDLKTERNILLIGIENIKNNSTNPLIVQETSKKLMSEFAISETNFSVTTKENTNSENAEKFEKEGFHFLINKDVDSAIGLFVKSENSYNGYHQVYEIARYLRKNKSKLENPKSEFWKTAYSDILSNFSWGMTDEIKSELKTQLKE